MINPRLVHTVLAAEIVLVACFAATFPSLDFHIYMWGGQAIADDSRLYVEQGLEHWFTNTPFAATLFAPLSALPIVPTRTLWQLATVGALAVACVATLRLAGHKPSRTMVAAAVAVCLVLEPVWHTIFLGQINLFLLALVLVDVLRVSRGRSAGIGIGIAAAIKLTPAIFIVLLLLTKRTKDAWTAAGTAAFCTFAAYVVAPDASRLYWSGLFHDTSRVGARYISNQSPFGAASRILDDVGSWYSLVPLVLGLIGLLTAKPLAGRGDWLAATAVTGVTALLVSPISWTHHWVWVIPVLAVLLRAGHLVPAACTALLFALAPQWWTPRESMTTLVSNCYLAAGLAFLAYMAVQACRVDQPHTAAPATAYGRGRR